MCTYKVCNISLKCYKISALCSSAQERTWFRQPEKHTKLNIHYTSISLASEFTFRLPHPIAIELQALQHLYRGMHNMVAKPIVTYTAVALHWHPVLTNLYILVPERTQCAVCHSHDMYMSPPFPKVCSYHSHTLYLSVHT